MGKLQKPFYFETGEMAHLKTFQKSLGLLFQAGKQEFAPAISIMTDSPTSFADSGEEIISL